ncbi:procyclic form surface glycoprotein, putative [Trypanosoma cruzi marinkellei]|uniref:Procyclic form surface glycoprotein, putative n=1 Tax=Trypanosoma cruzi marinkellei TaxID=85056 RepID=K2NCG1_TRYCR|nr:procyclic form surface glycoprotein, putative [Trypanosoma cruzi marinkellei]
MCLFGIVDAVAGFFKSVVACACCLIIGGPALIIAGSMLLNQQDLRKAFSDDVKEFNPTPLNAWTGTINDVPITVRRESLNVQGVDGAISVFAEAVVSVPQRSSSRFPVSVNVNTVASFVRKAPFRAIKKTSYTCTSSDCRSRLNCRCNELLNSFMDQCMASGGRFVRTSGMCVLDRTCGTCERTVYLRRLYLVVSEVGNGKYVEDTKLRSAMYPFGDLDNDYQPGIPSTVTVRLYSSKDPYIALQRLTRGSNDLGVNPRTVGIVLIVLGCLFLLLEIGVCTALICYWTRRKKTSSGATPYLAPASYGISTSGVSGNAAPNSYGQPAQPTGQGYTYGQAVPPGYTYGQPPQGQPIPQVYAYGQPVSPQGQHGYTYGQAPPPLYAYGQPVSPQGQHGQAPPPL